MNQIEPVVKSAHTLSARGYAAMKPGTALVPYDFSRRTVGPKDVRIDVAFCGICHSDIHQVRDEWSEGTFPMVPGHEIAGRVAEVGAQVTKFKVGDLAGVGCMVNSCRTCEACVQGLEQYCQNHIAFTYNSTEMDEKTPTYGGYSNILVVDEAFVLRLPSNIELARVAPLLCAGITTWSPLRHWKVGQGQRVGVVGLGGLGHMGVQLASKLGAEVTVFSRSSAKSADAKRLGAQHFIDTSVEGAMESVKRSFDFVLSTVSSAHTLATYVDVLKRDATLVVVGLPPHADSPPVDIMQLAGARRTVAGSMIGGIAETQEMLDFCGQHGIGSDVEVISIDTVNAAFQRVLNSDVRYRFVIDMATLQ